MESKVIPHIKQTDKKVCTTIMRALASAIREWVLIFLLFVEACFSYLVTKFARYSHLQTPCLLCSRLDHVLGKERSEFYWDLICHNHKLKISSLVLCHHHNNLVDVHRMCENCLFSFATVDKSNSETYRLLVGKLGAEPHMGLAGNSLQGDDSFDSTPKSCSCCNEQCIPRAYAPQLLQTKSIEFRGSELDLHLPLFENSGVDDEPKMSRDETFRAGKVSPSSISNFNPLPHVKYEKVKLTSDSESESQVSEKDTGSFLLEEYHKKEDLVSEKFIHPAPETQLSHLESEVKFEVINTKLAVEAVSTLENGHEGRNTLSIPESISFGDKSPSSLHGIDDAADVQTETLYVKAETEEAKESPGNCEVATRSISISTTKEQTYSEADIDERSLQMPELASTRDINPSSPCVIVDAVDVQKETLEGKEEGKVETEEVKESTEKCKDASQSISISTTKELTYVEPDIGGRTLQMPDSFELGDAYRLAIGSRGRQLSSKLLEQRSLSGKLFEQRSFRESSRGSEDFKLLLSQLSLARGIDPSLTDMSPRVPKILGEGIEVLQKRITLERNESNISLDGSTVSEIEGETSIDRLKRQVEHDKKLMCALYKELEEERNASAIAANQAMAMITRLQEEKAALHMEALQCLRMMDEQVEYDEEGLENAMNLLTEKEKAVQDLEVKLQLYTKKYGPLSIVEDMVDPFTQEPGANTMGSI